MTTPAATGAVASVLVDLNTLNKKQLVKEFKSTSKEIKSKDIAVKTVVLEKLKNPRYFIEGGCLVPFFDSVAPKKKTLDLSRMTLTCLQQFLKLPLKTDGETTGRTTLTILRASTLSLDSLKHISACVAYHEEKKKVKKGQPEIPEDPSAVAIRKQAGWTLYELTNQLYYSKPDIHLIELYGKIPDIVSHLFQNLKCLEQVFENVATREETVDEAANVLFCLASAVRPVDEHVNCIINEGYFPLILKYIKEKKLTVYCLQVLEVLNRHNPVGYSVVSGDPELRDTLVELLQTAANEFASSLVSAEQGGKEKAKPKDKSAAKTSSGDATSDGPINVPGKIIATQIKLITNILRQYVSTGQTLGESASIILRSLGSVVLNPEFWKICSTYVPTLESPGISLDDTVNSISVLIGLIGSTHPAQRALICAEGAVDLLASILIRSRTICEVPGDGNTFVPDAATDSEHETRIRQKRVASMLALRRSTEKAILHLTTDIILNSENISNSVGSKSRRWRPSEYRVENSDFLGSPSGTALLVKLTESIPSSDFDLANRAVRLISSIIQCSADPLEVLKRAGAADASISGKLSKFVESRAKVLIQEISAIGCEPSGSPREVNRRRALARESAALGISPENLLLFKWQEGEASGFRDPWWSPTSPVAAGELNACGVVLSDTLTSKVEGPVTDNESPDYLFPSISEGLCHGLIVLEFMLPGSSDIINACALQDTVSAMANLLYVCGPTGCSDGRRPAATAEYLVSLYDPYTYPWELRTVPGSSNGEFSYLSLRALSASVLSIIAKADRVYRSYQGTIPCAPLTMLPESTSPCYKASIMISKTCSDVCFSTLLAQSRFYFSINNDLLCGPKVDGSSAGEICQVGLTEPRKLREDVIVSFLSLAESIGGSGLAGISSCYEAIAITGQDESSSNNSALAVLKTSISEYSASVANAELANEAFKWSLPLFFENFHRDIRPTHGSVIVEQKSMWPMIIVAGALLGYISDPRSGVNVMAHAVRALTAFALIPEFEEENQPAVADLFSATTVALGGLVSLISASSVFGPLENESTEMVLVGQISSYLVNRGYKRSLYWDKVRADKLAEEAANAASAEAAGGKGKGGKDAAKAKEVSKPADKGAKKAAGGAVDEERIELPFEPTESHNDPNRGPSKDIWADLLNISADDYHSRSLLATPLTSLCQSRIGVKNSDVPPTILTDLIVNAGADINKIDAAGVSPLMYALLVGDRCSVFELLAQGANPNLIDKKGNPTVEYAFLTMHSENNSSLLSLIRSERNISWDNVASRDSRVINITGGHDLIDILLDHKVDLKVSNRNFGNFPLQLACGAAEIQVIVGGIGFLVQNKINLLNYKKTNTQHLLQRLVAGGADISSCNKLGTLPIHMVSAAADSVSLDYLLKTGAVANAVDSCGYTSVHYCAATCANGAVDALKLLLQWGRLRALEMTAYSDVRTGLTSEEKYWNDVTAALSMALSDIFCPPVIGSKRLSQEELLVGVVATGLSPLHLALAGRSLSDAHVQQFMPIWDNVKVRASVAEFLLDMGGDQVLAVKEGDGSVVSATNLTGIHTLSLLGVSEVQPKKFTTGYLSVLDIVGRHLRPQDVEGDQAQYIVLTHGNALLETNPVVVSLNRGGRGSIETPWGGISTAIDYSPLDEVIVALWCKRSDDASDDCLGSAIVPLQILSRNQLIIGEEVVYNLVLKSRSNEYVGSVRIKFSTSCDHSASENMGSTVLSGNLYSKILKLPLPTESANKKKGVSKPKKTPTAIVSKTKGSKSPSASAVASTSSIELDPVSVGKELFISIDKNRNGFLTHIELITALRNQPKVAQALQFPSSIRQQDGSKDKYLTMFREIDVNGSNTISLDEFISFVNMNAGKNDSDVISDASRPVNGSASGNCSWGLSNCKLPEFWTPLHSCIISHNRSLAMLLLRMKGEGSVSLTEQPYFHFFAEHCQNQNTFSSQFVEAVQSLSPAILNDFSREDPNGNRPIHSAVYHKNTALVNALIDCPRVDLNSRDSTGSTALLNACRAAYSISAVPDPKSIDVLKAFEKASDRLDFLIADDGGETSIDYAVNNRILELVHLLLQMRKNDVIERVFFVRAGSEKSLLAALEETNILLTRQFLRSKDLQEGDDVLIVTADTNPVGQRDELKEGGTEDSDRSNIMTELTRNENILSLFLKLVVEVGLAADLHLHECFSRGVLYREHCEEEIEKRKQVRSSINISEEDSASNKEDIMLVEN